MKRFLAGSVIMLLVVAVVAADTTGESDVASQFWVVVRDNLMNMIQISHSFFTISSEGNTFSHSRWLSFQDSGNSVGCYLSEDNTTRICQGRDTLGGMNVLYGSSCPVTATGLTECTCKITAHNNQTCQSCSFCDDSGAFSLDCRNVLISDYSCAGVDCYDNCLGRGYGDFDPSLVINTTNTATSGSANLQAMASLPLLVLVMLTTTTTMIWNMQIV